MASVGRQLVAGDVEGGTRRFFEDALGPGAWGRVPAPVQRAAMGNAQTFVDMLADPGWGALDVAAVARFPGPVLITYGGASPAWLPHVARSVSERIGRGTRIIAGAGHTPHHTHPDALAAVIRALADRPAARRAA
jgi:pimeloyl-ACP methyl ester carboxylesterase